MWAALLPIIEALGIGGAEAAGARAGMTATESMAAKQSTQLAGEQAAADSGISSDGMTKFQKQRQKEFHALFEPTRQEKDEKAARDKQEEARKEKERTSDPGHQKATEWFQKSARYVDDKSLGQGMFDWIKKNDKSGVAGLAMAGMDFAGSLTARGINAGGKVIRDDFKGLADEILPDSLRKVVSAFDNLSKEIVDKGRYLSRYSGDLAYSSARADVRRMQTDYREAQGPGREYSRVIDESSKLETKLRNAFGPIKEAIASAIASILQMLNKLLDMTHAAEILVVIGEIAKVAAKFLTLDPAQIAEAIFNLPTNIAEAIKKSIKGEEVDLDMAITRAVDGLANPNNPHVPIIGADRNFGRGRFDFPIAGGI